MGSDVALRVRTDVAEERPALMRFVVCGQGRVELWEVSLGREGVVVIAFGRCGVVLSRAVFERRFLGRAS